MSISDTILSAIGGGEDNAVSSTALQAVTGLTDRELRKAIEHLRRAGHVIASCDRGYFIPETLAEVRAHILKESRRARSIFFTLRSAKLLERAMQAKESCEADA